MYKYTIDLSDRLIQMERDFGAFGPYGIPKYTTAESMEDALTRVFESAVVEVVYDISGEWIEITENETGRVHRHTITKIPDFDRYLGEFEFNSVMMYGERAVYGEKDPVYQETFGIFIRRAADDYGDLPWQGPMNLITDVMPQYFVDMTIQEISEGEPYVNSKKII